MKKIVLVALLAAAACSGKKSGSDCDAAIAKGIENFSKNMKEHAPNPQIVERMTGVMDKLKGVLIERCKADNWAPEIVTCFTTVNNRKDMQACQSKLTPDQSSKLTGQIAQVMMSEGGMMGQRMPPGMPGHPAMLQGNNGAPGAAAGSAGGSADSAAPAATPPATPPAAPPAAAEGSAAAPAGSGSPK